MAFTGILQERLPAVRETMIRMHTKAYITAVRLMNGEFGSGEASRRAIADLGLDHMKGEGPHYQQYGDASKTDQDQCGVEQTVAVIEIVAHIEENDNGSAALPLHVEIGKHIVGTVALSVMKQAGARGVFQDLLRCRQGIFGGGQVQQIGADVLQRHVLVVEYGKETHGQLGLCELTQISAWTEGLKKGGCMESGIFFARGLG